MNNHVSYKEKCGLVEPSTIRGYRYEAKQIARYLGNERLGHLTIPMINDWMAQMTADSYAPKTVAKPFRLLKQALNYVIAQDMLSKTRDTSASRPSVCAPRLTPLPREERSRMLKLAREALPEPLALAIEFALTTGMRRGEVCALRRSGFNHDGTITVSRALRNAEGGFYVKEPKTAGRSRTIPLMRYTYQMLSAVKADAMHLLTRLGVAYADPYILGTHENESHPYNPTLLGKDFAAFCKMNGFNCTFHDLRHTFATFMIGAGVDVRTVARYLGRSSVSMTLDIYPDVDPDAKFGAVHKIEEALDDVRNDMIPDAARYNGYGGEGCEGAGALGGSFGGAGAGDTEEIPGASPVAARNSAGLAAGMGNFTLSAQSLPFTEEELEDMLAKVRTAKMKKVAGSL